jgi:hypothetical protein
LAGRVRVDTQDSMRSEIDVLRGRTRCRPR